MVYVPKYSSQGLANKLNTVSIRIEAPGAKTKI